MAGRRVLIVEDERVVAEQLRQTLTTQGYEVIGVADSGEQAIAEGRATRPDVVIMDILLSGSVDGIAAAQQLQPLGIPVIYLTAYSDRHLLDRAQHTRPLAYVMKPAKPGELQAVIQLALFKREHETKAEQDGHGGTNGSRETKDQFRLMVAGVTNHAVFTLDPNGNVNSWNPGAERINGYSDSEIMGRSYAVLFTGEDRSNNVPETELEEARKHGSADDTRWLLRKNGERYWAEGALTAIRDNKGVLTGFAKITRDATDRKKVEEALRVSEERLGIALRAARTGTWHWDIPSGTDILDANLCALFGIPAEQSVSTIERFFNLVHRDDRSRVKAEFERTRHEGVHLDTEFRVVRPDGEERWFIDQGEVIRNERGKPDYMAGACVDITERKHAEIALRESEERFRLFANNVREYALFLMDLEGRIVTWNSGAERLLGYTSEEIIGQPSACIFVPEDVAAGEAQREMREAATGGQAIDERWHLRKDGTRFWCSGVLTAIHDGSGTPSGFAKLMRDETERRNASEQLKASLNEKEVLLKEIHHRVKNNLQVITSLLSLQSDVLGDEKVREMFEEACNRVRSIGDIHELLYRSPDLARISFAAYLERMAEYLLSFYNFEAERVKVSTASNVNLELSEAIPCGLIVNELLTNSLKHGFRGGRSGRIEVSLHCENGVCLLEVADDGAGLPDGFKLEETHSLGLKLVSVLARQLRGELRVQRDEGTRVTLKFPQADGEGPAQDSSDGSS